MSKKFLARIIKEQDTMKASDLIKSLRKTFHSETFQNRHKSNPTDFSRKPVLRFSIIFNFILKGIKNSLQTDLFNLTDIASLPADVSKQAFSDALKEKIIVKRSVYMSIQKIIYKDPKESEVGAIIDLTDKPESSATSKIGSYKGREVQCLDEKENNSTKKK